MTAHRLLFYLGFFFILAAFFLFSCTGQEERVDEVATGPTLQAMEDEGVDFLWDQVKETKPLLGYLLSNPKRLERLENEFGLSSSALSGISKLVEEENRLVRELYIESHEMIRNPDLSLEEKTEAVIVMGFNTRTRKLALQTLDSATHILGRENAERFGEWLKSEWLADRQEHFINAIKNAKAGQKTFNKFTTQYFGNSYNIEASVPDYYPKFANLGWEHNPGYPNSDYKIKIARQGRSAVVKVWDVGPWNIEDGYWNTANHPQRPRRMWIDLPMGTSEAEAAYYNNYNGGLDQYGRTVIVPCSIDLTPDAAALIGLAYLQNDWIDVTWLWEPNVPCSVTSSLGVSKYGYCESLANLAILLFPLALILFLKRRKY